MTDKELLELAAKSAGWTIEENGTDVNDLPWYWCHQLKDNWNPLEFDSDALRLAVKLRFLVDIGVVSTNIDGINDRDQKIASEIHLDDDPYAATRRAIVRAAAEIGKTL